MSAAEVVLTTVAAILAAGAVLWTLRTERRRRAADAILERRLELALTGGGMTTWLWDADRDALAWDERAAVVYGVQPPSSSAAWLETVHPDDRDGVREALERSVAGRTAFHVVHRLGADDHGPRWFEMRGEPVVDARDRLLGTAGVVVDVTEEHRAAAELATTRSALEQILDVTPVLTSEAPPDEVPARICDAAVAVFDCDGCGIWTVEGDTAVPSVCVPAAMADVMGARIRLADLPALREQLGRRMPAQLVSGSGDPAVEAAMAELGAGSAVVVPLAEHDGAPLHLTLWWRGTDPASLGLLAAIRRFADQAALALAQARARTARDEVDALNETLQEGLLPAPVVQDTSLRVVARYRPGERRILLGGDFYDVVERPDGQVAFVVGDVTGHGARPAAVGAALRSAWRALVLGGDDPASWLTVLGSSLASYRLGPELLVTACTGLLARDRSSIAIANAGHPPPMLLTPDGADPLDMPPGIALGLAEPGAGIATTRVDLPEGWRLLLYTDGALEVRVGGSADRLGEEGLTGWLRREAAGLGDDALLDALASHLEDVNAGPLHDDLATVLIAAR